jgi:hypothetical protein
MAGAKLDTYNETRSKSLQDIHQMAVPTEELGLLSQSAGLRRVEGVEMEMDEMSSRCPPGDTTDKYVDLSACRTEKH